VELSRFSLEKWSVWDGRKRQTIRLAVHHLGSEEEVKRYAELAKKVVREEIGVFGELPRFDYGTYTFIADYLPWATGDGMEHRDSTILTSARALDSSVGRLIGTVAHEFFHCWNVERLRPRSLEPFDFERANICGELWFAEGFTSYYTPLVLRRAGLIDNEDFAKELARRLNEVLLSPGRRFRSPVEMSREAPFHDGFTAKDPTNSANTYISYYAYGAVLALGLDLTLRTRFPGVTLDEYMRAMWEEFGRAERPYTLADLETVLGRVTKDKKFAGDFFRRYIQGRELPDYGALLEKAGFLLRRAEGGKASLGPAELRFGKGGAQIESATRIGTPLYEAGLDRGATIVSLNRTEMRNPQSWDLFLRKRKPGDQVDISYQQRGKAGRAKVALAAAGRIEVIPFERAGRRRPKAVEAFRAAWLGSKAVPGGSPAAATRGRPHAAAGRRRPLIPGHSGLQPAPAR